MIAAFLRVVVFSLAFLFLMVNVHEVGHTVFARLLGDDSAHYLLYQQRGSSTCMGCNLYDSSHLGNAANVLVNLGGVIFTQLLCWAAVLLLARRNQDIPRWMLLTVIVITWSGDVVLQLVQGLVANVPQELPRGPERTYTDYLAVVWFTRNETGVDTSELKVGLLIGTIAYSALLLVATSWSLKRGRSRSMVTPE